MIEPIGYNSKRAREILDQMGIDVLVASSDVNVFYTTGLPTTKGAPNPILMVLKNQFPNLSLVRRDGELSLIYWMLFSSMNKFSWVKDVAGILSPQQALNTLEEKLGEWNLGNKTIALESQMPRYQSEFLRAKFPQAKFVEADEALLRMRLVKSQEEIQRITKSSEITESAIQAMIDAAHEGITDYELLQVARRAIVDAGAEAWDHLTMGIGASDPEAPGVGTVMHKGDITRFDVGTSWKGYISDISRHMVLGAAPEGADEVVDRLMKTQEYCISQVKPGVKPADVAKAGMEFHKTLKKVIKPIITCHSVGLECEETQLFSLVKTYPRPFEENMVMDIEIWQPFKNFGLLGVEDTFRVTKDGCVRINKLDKRIVVK